MGGQPLDEPPAFSYEASYQMPVKLTANEGLEWQSRVGRPTGECRSARDAASHGTQAPILRGRPGKT